MERREDVPLPQGNAERREGTRSGVRERDAA